MAAEGRGRLSRAADFDAVYRRGRSRASRHLVAYAFERPAGDATAPRLGVAVSRRVGVAVARNRLKRQLREAFAEVHCSEGAALAQRDFVLVARPGLVEATEAGGYQWLVGELRGLLAPGAGEAAPAPARPEATA